MQPSYLDRLASLPGLRGIPSFLRPAFALVGILLLDLVQTARNWHVAVVGLLDEPAHLLTAWLFVAACTGRTARLRVLPWLLAGSVLLDLDHVPLFLGAEWIAATPGGRPVTHSLITIVLLLTASAMVRPWRLPLAGVAAGTATQLVRDLSTGPGIPLFWPLLDGDVRLPYLPYLGILVALAVAATILRWKRRPPAPGRPLRADGVPRRGAVERPEQRNQGPARWSSARRAARVRSP